jgi:hypothetical protein
MERDVFILTLYLNPYIRGTTFSKKNPALKPLALYNIAKRLLYTFDFSKKSPILISTLPSSITAETRRNFLQSTCSLPR